MRAVNIEREGSPARVLVGGSGSTFRPAPSFIRNPKLNLCLLHLHLLLPLIADLCLQSTFFRLQIHLPSNRYVLSNLLPYPYGGTGCQEISSDNRRSEEARSLLSRNRRPPKSTELLIRKLPFQRLVEIAQYFRLI
ncbi:hypothetical protein L1987_48840 [Smallanthus sonchifolius]|uniref:Uncharacterized protein n=1 Tax=Smallanthus sonchifolius TaxID=185202 RepID=A0ACB9FTK7_9ASTR|nr:hypothetical protein L1987_48840 [Smallanthus sonchifolius]